MACNNGYADGMKFSTSDADNDLAVGNCASGLGGGWWHNNCYCVSLTTSTTYWRDITGIFYYLADARMMMKVQRFQTNH